VYFNVETRPVGFNRLPNGFCWPALGRITLTHRLALCESGCSGFLFNSLQVFLKSLVFFLNLFNLTGNFGRCGTAFGGQQGFAAIGTATPTGVFRFEIGCVGLVNDQTVVVIEFFAGLDGAKGLDVNAIIFFIGFAVGVTTVIDPPGRVSAVQCIDDPVFIHMKVEGVVGVGGIVRVAVLRFIPADDFTDIFVQSLAFRNVQKRKDAFAMDA